MLKDPENTPGENPLNQPSYNPPTEHEVFLTPQQVLEHTNRLLNEDQPADEEPNLLKVKKASEWLEEASMQAIPQMLFSEFWHEGELCILFADTNLGKSILAVQIAESISSGLPIPGFKMEATAQPVLYFDFELSAKQFENRYSESYTNHYAFSQNFLRVEIDPDAQLPHQMEFEDYLIYSMERAIRRTGAKVLLVDNLSYLGTETEKARNALSLMHKLKDLKSLHSLSMLVLAHTPKRDLSKPISRNDLQGSKTLINFCDSSFTVGESNQDKSLRYLKQIKARNTEHVYDAENICLCKIDKPHNFLQFEFLQYGKEAEHLRQQEEKERSELEMQVRELMLAEPNLAPYALAKKICPENKNFNAFRVRVDRIVKKLKDAA